MLSTVFYYRKQKIAMPQPWQAIAQRFCSILIYYDDYINTLATVKAEDAQGNEYQYVDGDLKTRIQMKLVDAIPKWRGLRNVDDRFI